MPMKEKCVVCPYMTLFAVSTYRVMFVQWAVWPKHVTAKAMSLMFTIPSGKPVGP